MHESCLASLRPCRVWGALRYFRAHIVHMSLRFKCINSKCVRSLLNSPVPTNLVAPDANAETNDGAL